MSTDVHSKPAPTEAQQGSSMESSVLRLTVDFTGGLELIFSNKRVHQVDVPAHDPEGSPSNISFLIKYLCDTLRDDPRQEFFVMDDGKTIRPGILVLINDADWELEGEEAYELQDGDCITFMSTLHGG